MADVVRASCCFAFHSDIKWRPWLSGRVGRVYRQTYSTHSKYIQSGCWCHHWAEGHRNPGGVGEPLRPGTYDIPRIPGAFTGGVGQEGHWSMGRTCGMDR